MGYVAVQGGQEAIEASLELLDWERVRSGRLIETKDIQGAFPDLIDQVMGESSLYAPELAALALKQAQGSTEEAVFLLRAFRSTLERPHVSRIVETEHMQVKRRISAAFKDIPGGQILGATRDYSHRLIDFTLDKEDVTSLQELRKQIKQSLNDSKHSSDKKDESSACFKTLPKVSTYLRKEGLLAEHEPDNTLPTDTTMEPLVFPSTRSARLQILARGMTQAVSALGYAAIRGFGPAHPTVAELRYGSIEIALDHPSGAKDDEQPYYIGSIPVTEVESLFVKETTGSEVNESLEFEIGYGLVIGRCETKAIAMSVLDNCLMHGDTRFPTQDEEFVLYHVDSVEATGFISHLKLPHYVTFQSKLSSIRKTHESKEEPSQDPASKQTVEK